jgi:hypothetical protein
MKVFMAAEQKRFFSEGLPDESGDEKGNQLLSR